MDSYLIGYISGTAERGTPIFHTLSRIYMKLLEFTFRFTTFDEGAIGHSRCGTHVGSDKSPNSHEILVSYIVMIIFLKGTPRGLISTLGAKDYE